MVHFTMEKNYKMVLWKDLWYCTENYGTSIYEGEKHCRLPKPKKLSFIMENPKLFTRKIEVF